jgi:hypothetical protein
MLPTRENELSDIELAFKLPDTAHTSCMRAKYYQGTLKALHLSRRSLFVSSCLRWTHSVLSIHPYYVLLYYTTILFCALIHVLYALKIWQLHTVAPAGLGFVFVLWLLIALITIGVIAQSQGSIFINPSVLG